MARQQVSSATRPTRLDIAMAAKERARWAKEQADFVALKNRKPRGELVEVAKVRAEWVASLSRLRSAMLAIPSRMAHLGPGGWEALDQEIRAALTALADDQSQSIDCQSVPNGSEPYLARRKSSGQR